MTPDVSPPSLEDRVEAARWAQHRQVEHNMTNHTPTPEAVEIIESIRWTAKALGHRIVDLCPDSREKSLAQTHLEQAVFWAVASIAREQ